MSLVSIDTIVPGDIVQFSNKAGGGLYNAPGSTRTFGYVSELKEVGDRFDHFEVFEIVPMNKHSAKKLDGATKPEKLEIEAVRLAGLDQTHEWQVILEPRRLYPNKKNLDQRTDGLIEKRGNITTIGFRNRIQSSIEDMGGADAIRRRGGDNTGYASASANNTWGLYAPIGIQSGAWKEEDWGFQKPKRLKKPGRVEDKQFGTLGAEEGLAIDLPLVFANAALGLNEDLLNAVMNPNSKELKPVKTLRQLKDVTDLKPYLEDRQEFIFSGTLLQAQKTGLLRDGYVRDMLSETFDGEGFSKPITRFKEALETAINNPDRILEDMVKINDDEEEQGYVIDELEEAQADHLAGVAVESTKEINAAWAKFANDYLAQAQGQAIENPDRYINSGDDVGINIVKAVGRRKAQHIVIQQNQSAAIKLPNSLYRHM